MPDEWRVPYLLGMAVSTPDLVQRLGITLHLLKDLGYNIPSVYQFVAVPIEVWPGSENPYTHWSSARLSSRRDWQVVIAITVSELDRTGRWFASSLYDGLTVCQFRSIT